MSRTARSTEERVPIDRLRRVAVAAAGLHRSEGFGRGRGAGARVLEHLGYVQVDTISVVRRAHEHIVDVRAPGFDARHYNRLVQDGEAFEYWAHAAAYLPMRDFRYSLPRMEQMRAAPPFSQRADAKTRQFVLDRIRAEGPLRIRDFDEDSEVIWGGWGRYKQSKFALEQLWHQGSLLIVGRDGFEKTYDLAERALPDSVDLRTPTTEEMAAHLVERARRMLGVFTAAHVTWLRRDAVLRKTVTQHLEDAVANGALLEVALPGDGPATRWFADAAAVADPPRVSRRARMLSPFDPLVLHRDRGERLFDFAYQLECYVPAEKRRHGYFVLPILHGSEFIGRADCKADRARKRFEVRRLFVESDASVDVLAPALDAAARDLAARDDCTELDWQEISAPGNTRTLRTELQRLAKQQE